MPVLILFALFISAFACAFGAHHLSSVVKTMSFSQLTSEIIHYVVSVFGFIIKNALDQPYEVNEPNFSLMINFLLPGVMYIIAVGAIFYGIKKILDNLDFENQRFDSVLGLILMAVTALMGGLFLFSGIKLIVITAALLSVFLITAFTIFVIPFKTLADRKA
jgi:hypothetical protein